MPFCKYNKLEDSIYSNNIFTNGVIRFRELEDDFWVLVTDITFKANVKTRAIADGENDDYYFLSFLMYKTVVPLHGTSINNIVIPSLSWSLFKSGSEISAYHYKGTNGLLFNFIFSKEWLEKNLSISLLPDESPLKQLFNNKTEFTSWENLVPEAEVLAKEIWENLKKIDDRHFNTLQIKIQTLNIITQFFNSFKKSSLIEQATSVSESDKRSIKKAEKIINDHLSSIFPGIDFIAKSVHLSPTKLKSCFKTVYGTSILQYYKEKKMLLAMEMIKNSEEAIKTISKTLGYENGSKFSAAFKQQFGVLPSEVRGVSTLIKG